MITLTDEKRAKFAAWLHQEADSDDLIIGQLRNMHGIGHIANQKSHELAAKLLVARVLESIHEETIT